MDNMGFFHRLATRAAIAIGLVPKPVSTAHEYALSFAAQSRKLRAILFGVFGWAITYAFFLLLGAEPSRIDQSYVLLAVILLIGLLDLARLQLQVIQLWAAQTLTLLPALAQQHHQIQGLFVVNELKKLIEEIRAEGWLFAVGDVNTANQTGCMTFACVWKPKVEARAYSGTGRTLEEALRNAIETMRKAAV